MSWYNPFSWFSKEEPEETYPYERVLIDYTDIAKTKGIRDNYNKVILIYKGEELIEEHPYSKELIEHLKTKEEMCVFDLTKTKQDDEFEFYPFEDLGGVTR